METNRFKLGLFTALGIVLFIGAITCMGVFDFLQDTGYLVTTVRESVQGLNTGSNVKLRGVPIGKIEDITILMDSKDKDIRITMKVDLNKFGKKSETLFSGNPISRADFYAIMDLEVQKGLRCRIEPDGITGSKYLEIDFFDSKCPDPEKNDKKAGKGADQKKDPLYSASVDLQNGYFFIPSIPSMMSTVKLNMTEILAKIANIDFDGISKRTSILLDRANQLLDPKQTEALMSNITGAVSAIHTSMDNFNAALPPQKMRELIREAQLAVIQIRSGVEELQKVVRNSDVPGTFTRFRELSGDIKTLSGEAGNTMQKLNDTVDALTELIQNLQEDPSSIIHGRKNDDLFPAVESPEKGRKK